MEIPRIVIDTNVFVSGTTIAHNPSSQVIQAWKDEKLEVASSEPLLTELVNTLRKPKVQKITAMTQAEEEIFVDFIRANALIVSGTTPVNVSPDPDDNILFSCAIEAQADYIVSGDKNHVLVVPNFQGIRTISPRDFVEQIILKIA